MMKTLFSILFFLTMVFSASAQKKEGTVDLSKEHYIIENLQEDTVNLRDKASQTLRALKNGAVIVRLKTNDKSVAAYRKTGRNDIADKIIENRRAQNQRMYLAFERGFKFCRVYFIYANQTTSVLNGNYKVFLNSNLEVDSSIIFTDTTFVFCEYGSVESFSDFQQDVLAGHGSGANSSATKKILDTIPSQTSTSPATTSGLFFSDKNLKQFHRPFPSAEGVYLDNFTPSVAYLSNRLFKEYGLLVKLRDYKDKMKAEKKKQKQQLKQLK